MTSDPTPRLTIYGKFLNAFSITGSSVAISCRIALERDLLQPGR